MARESYNVVDPCRDYRVVSSGIGLCSPTIAHCNHPLSETNHPICGRTRFHFKLSKNKRKAAKVKRELGRRGRTVTEVPTSMKLIIKLIEFT